MCGRGVRPDGVELAEAIEADLVDPEVRVLPVRHNLAPTDPLGVLRRDDAGRHLLLARWGVPRHRGGIAINARDDRLRGPMWRTMLRRGRAVVPLRGFYEWEGPQRQPWYFRRGDGGLLLLAGLVLADAEGLHATIVTTEPSRDIGGVHDRMPAVLEPDMVEPWLRGEDPQMLLALVRPAPDGTLLRHTVGRRVNSVRNDGPELVEPVAPIATQGELF
ncbi:SOS response-associated peptidase [Paraliomyxa miuraensis]|uniref:SOS response-associated peptidase n=1 Tax=Paraliomyxa miuraensis TaxID=376150 RepID=UPI00225335D0|nr:SOS response-associated peptidase family protein [Paraliomyxa miuraensis]MCX4245336.1 SOS response-associated peptidase [Paraliomyxa miuraensis]